MQRAQGGARPLLVGRPIQIQPYDIDFAAHVNNAVYVRWLEDLRMDMLRAYCPMRPLMEEGLAPVVAATHIRYVKPLKLFDAPVGRMWCAEMGRATLTLEAEIAVGDTVYTAATQRVMMVNWQTEKAARVPLELRERFAREAGP
ncbi:MAG: acyl-CoA thioesterase [Candidatus Hydrogenedentes bacterium]|nr:acyl-CoA thioesterase [Candidatus Hydrogenedentota bacterium]